MEEAPRFDKLKRLLNEICSKATCALREIEEFEEKKACRWRCITCGREKHFTKEVAAVACDVCPRCRGVVFMPVDS